MITSANVIKDNKERKNFLIKQANVLIKNGNSSKRMFKLRNELRRENKNYDYYLPIMADLADEIHIHHMMKE